MSDVETIEVPVTRSARVTLVGRITEFVGSRAADDGYGFESTIRASANFVAPMVGAIDLTEQNPETTCDRCGRQVSWQAWCSLHQTCGECADDMGAIADGDALPGYGFEATINLAKREP